MHRPNSWRRVVSKCGSASCLPALLTQTQAEAERWTADGARPCPGRRRRLVGDSAPARYRYRCEHVNACTARIGCAARLAAPVDRAFSAGDGGRGDVGCLRGDAHTLWAWGDQPRPVVAAAARSALRGSRRPRDATARPPPRSSLPLRAAAAQQRARERHPPPRVHGDGLMDPGAASVACTRRRPEWWVRATGDRAAAVGVVAHQPTGQVRCRHGLG